MAARMPPTQPASCPPSARNADARSWGLGDNVTMSDVFSPTYLCKHPMPARIVPCHAPPQSAGAGGGDLTPSDPPPPLVFVSGSAAIGSRLHWLGL